MVGRLVEHGNVGECHDCLVLLVEVLLGDELGYADDDARRVEVVVQSLALAQEFRCEKQVETFYAATVILGVHVAAETDRYG